MSKYSDWMLQQDEDFQNEVLRGRSIGDKFIDYGEKPLSLAELEALDNQHIFNDGD